MKQSFPEPMLQKNFQLELFQNQMCVLRNIKIETVLGKPRDIICSPNTTNSPVGGK